MARPVTIMGIDPGLASTGWGLIVCEDMRAVKIDYGCVRTTKKIDLPERLFKIYRDLKALAKEHQPDILAIEELFFSSNQLTAIQVAQARGVAILAFAELGISVHEYSPVQIKKSVTGYGRASKMQVQQMVMRHLNLEEIPKPDHCSDALATGLCHIFHSKFDELT